MVLAMARLTLRSVLARASLLLLRESRLRLDGEVDPPTDELDDIMNMVVGRLELELEYVWVYLLKHLAVLFFQKKIKINDDTTSRSYNFEI